MKKPKLGKIRKIWTIKPQTRVKKAAKRELLERAKNREVRRGE